MKDSGTQAEFSTSTQWNAAAINKKKNKKKRQKALSLENLVVEKK